MAYKKQGFADGNVLTAAQLIKMEEGIIESNADLVIGVNITNTRYPPNDWASNLDDMTADDVVIMSGNLTAVAEKVKNYQPVRVLLNEINFYGNRAWSRGVAEATHVSITSSNAYPSDVYGGLAATFFVTDIAGYSATHPILFSITFNIESGAVTLVHTTSLW